MIEGVKSKTLRVIPDERGRVMEILRADEELFVQFGQIYLTTAYPGVVKAWRGHKERIDNLVALQGMIKLVLYDKRTDSPTHGEIAEYFMGEHNPLLVHVPAGVLHGYKCLGENEAIVLNCSTVPFFENDPDLIRIDPFSATVPYRW
jgi:dTDP-4-dehydrorhamnose 3,5-epimerase